MSTTTLDFGPLTLGSYEVMTFTVTNTSASPDTISEITGDMGPDPYDFYPSPETSCGANANGGFMLQPGASCAVDVYFTPGALGDRSTVLDIIDDVSSAEPSVDVSGVGTIGYYQVDSPGQGGRLRRCRCSTATLRAPRSTTPSWE